MLDVFRDEPLREESSWGRTKGGKEGQKDVVMTPYGKCVSEGIMRSRTIENRKSLVKGRRGVALVMLNWPSIS